MLKKLSLLLLILAITPYLYAQTTKKTSFSKYGMVDITEFATKVKGPDSAAAAIKLFDIGTASFELSSKTAQFIYVFERHVRYRIVNKNAYDLANQEIALYKTNERAEILEAVSANTFNLVNGKIEINSLSKDAKFSEAYDKNHTIKKFTLPNVKEGSIIEFKYKTSSEFLFTLDSWYFQGDYPSLYSSFTITVPEFYSYKVTTTGYVNLESVPLKVSTRNFYIPSTLNSKSGNVTAEIRTAQYIARDIPAIKTENFITTLKDYISKISFELSSTMFPGSGYHEYTTTWSRITKEFIAHPRFGGYLNRKNYPKDFIQMPGDGEDQENKMISIFNQVKNKLKWDGKYNTYTTDNNPKKIAENLSGNSAEINLLLLSLLQQAGLDCAPVLLSTRTNGEHPGYPLTTPFNNIIVAVQLNDKNILLDATDKNNAPDLINYQCLNHQGLKMNLEGLDAGWIVIEPGMLSKSTIVYNLKLDKDAGLKGNLYLTNSGYDGLEKRQKYQVTASEKDYIKNFQANKPGLSVTAYQIKNLNDPTEALTEQMEITLEDRMEEAGNLIYFKPILMSNFEENPFRIEDRKYPVDFAYPHENHYRLVLEYPEDYKLETLPKNEAFKLPDDAGTFSIIFITEGNKILVNSKLALRKAIYSAEEYYDLRELFKNVIRKQAEQIVFKK